MTYSGKARHESGLQRKRGVRTHRASALPPLAAGGKREMAAGSCRPPHLSVQALLERSVGIGNAEQVRGLLATDLQMPQPSARTDALLQMTAFREGGQWRDITGLLLRHPTTTQGCSVLLLREVLAKTCCVERMVDMCGMVFAVFPGLGVSLREGDVTPAFQTAGAVTRRVDLFSKSAGLQLAELLFRNGVRRPPCAYFPAPRELTADDLETDVDFPPSQATRMQLMYARCRRHLRTRITLVLLFARKHSPAMSCSVDTLVTTASFVPFGHSSLYPR